MSNDDHKELTEEWQQIFDTIQNRNGSAKDFTVQSFRPVFVFKTKKDKRIKLGTTMTKLCGNSFHVKFSNSDTNEYQFSLVENSQILLKTGIDALDKIKGDSWTDKWDEATKIHSGNTHPPAEKINVDKNEPLQIQCTTQNKKRKLNFTNVTGTKFNKFNDFSSLIRIEKSIQQDIIKSPLRDGQGICINERKRMCT